MTHEDLTVSEARQADDSDKVSMIDLSLPYLNSDAKMWARLMMSWVRLMIMRFESLICWVMNDDELDEISDLWGLRLVEADDLLYYYY